MQRNIIAKKRQKKRRLRPRDSDDLPSSSSHASWMDPSPPRQHPLHRANATRRATLASEPPQRRRPPTPARPADDTLDLARPTAGVPPWAPVYRAIGDRRLPRDHRLVAWRLLHGLLPCGAFLLHVQPSAAADAASTCGRPACRAAPANLTHIFLSCQLAQSIVGWLCDVWAAIEPGNRPPATFAVIAVGDPAAWQPGSPVLWTRLRLRVLHELWRSRSVGSDIQQPPMPASAVASRIVLGAAADMRLDWLRATMPAHALADACGTWMTGGGQPQSPDAAKAQFAQLWCVNGTLCQLSAVGATQPHIRWSHAWPVPFPPDLPVSAPASNSYDSQPLPDAAAAARVPSPTVEF